jgi:hypothetical protein
MDAVSGELPNERAYMPCCPNEIKSRLGLIEGESAQKIATLGKGKNFK